jgi:hypothetical protein
MPPPRRTHSPRDTRARGPGQLTHRCVELRTWSHAGRVGRGACESAPRAVVVVCAYCPGKAHVTALAILVELSASDPSQEPDPQHPESLCRVVSGFSDEMPCDVVASLLRLPYNVCDSVGSDRSYANGARCLAEFIKIKRQLYNGKR